MTSPTRRSRTSPRWGVAALTCLLLARPSARADEKDKAPPPDAPPAPAATAEPKLKLLEAGAEPRAVLRLKSPKGAREKGKATVRTTMRSDGTDMPSPTMGMELTTEVKEVLTNGDRTYDIVVDALTMDLGPDAAEMAETMAALLETVKGARFSVSVTERGKQTGTKVTLPEGSHASMSQALEQAMDQLKDFGPPFLPEEAVGVGARWEIAGPVTESGMTVDQTMTFTLTAAAKGRISLDMDMVQTAKAQKFSEPVVPGLEATLESLTSKGKGQLEFDLARILPVKANASMTMTMAMKVGGEGAETTKMEMTLQATMSGEPLPAAAPGGGAPK